MMSGGEAFAVNKADSWLDKLWNRFTGSVAQEAEAVESDPKPLVASYGDIFASAVFCARKNKKAFPTFAKTTKLGEEVGELMEAVLNHNRLINKPNAGTPIEECADVILTALDVAQDCYPDATEEELVEALRQEIVKKFAKWRTLMDLS